MMSFKGGLRKLRRSRLTVVLLVAVIASVVFAAAAAAWAQTYVSGQYISVSGPKSSSYNSNLDWNEASTQVYNNEEPFITLCPDSNNVDCYSAKVFTNGYAYDTRSISYGRAMCGLFAGANSLWFNYCDTSNN